MINTMCLLHHLPTPFFCPYLYKLDNTRIHGPGGQTSYDVPSEADPCFAKVVEGFEAVDRMLQTPVKPGNYKHMVENVGIASATILGYDG